MEDYESRRQEEDARAEELERAANKMLKKVMSEGLTSDEVDEVGQQLAEARVLRESAAVGDVFAAARMVEREDGTVVGQVPERALLDLIAKRKDLPPGEAEEAIPELLRRRGARRVQLDSGEWVYEIGIDIDPE